MTIRVVVIGVSHWHLRLFVGPLKERDDVEIVGVSDPDGDVAAQVAGELGCTAYLDFTVMLAEAVPDFAMVLGPHNAMAATAAHLIDVGIAFAIEKPAGLNGAEVAAIAARAERAGAFAAVPFVFRQNGWVTKMRERSAAERFEHLSFTMIGRPPQQYERMHSGWMLDRALAGGGALINLGIHFLDLIPYLVSDEPVEVVAAVLSNAAWGLSIEDYAAVTLRLGSSIATIQTGYRYASPKDYMDLHFSVRTDGSYYVVRSSHEVEVTTPDGGYELWDVGTLNVDTYPVFVNDALDRFQRGEKPAADLGDAARAMALLDRIYAAAGVAVAAPAA